LLFENSTHHISDAFIKPGIYQVRKLFDDNFDYTLNFGEDRKKTKLNDYNVVKENFVQELKNTLTNIFSTEKPFEQTNNTDACKSCQYAQICER
jgi:radical SAM protein with 4Fe4S-binding SPASM domain